MPEPSKMELQIRALADLEKRELEDQSTEILAESLASRYHLVVARAAKISAKLKWYAGVPHLVKAFEAMAENGAKSDPGCIAKTEIIRAISHLNARECELFVKGIQLKQFEPVWGGREDRAANLRAASAFALAKQGCQHAVIQIAELLADGDIEARTGAAQALSCIADDAAVALLRLRALCDEREPRVLQEIFASLLSLSPVSDEDQETDATVSFIGRFLNSEETDIASVATIALGASRRYSAFQTLRDFAKAGFDSDRKRLAFEAIAILRLPAAFDHIIETIERGSREDARLAEASISIYPSDKALWERVRRAKSVRT